MKPNDWMMNFPSFVGFRSRSTQPTPLPRPKMSIAGDPIALLTKNGAKI
jgi:hypothetical protein